MPEGEKIVDQLYLRNQQYRNADKLRARIQLHRLFGTNPYPWQRWVFDQLQLETGQIVLELGSGPGDFWRENLDRLPDGLQVFLSDLSIGMITTAQQVVTKSGQSIRLFVQDAQALAIGSNQFDWVIANHMLYHLPDLEKGLREIQRVLKPGGRLCAATNGYGHLREVTELIDLVLPGYSGVRAQLRRFALEDAQENLQEYFTQIQVKHYLDDLEVTQAEPLLAYIASMWEVSEVLDQEGWHTLEREIFRRLSENGKLTIHKSQGLVIARPKA